MLIIIMIIWHSNLEIIFEFLLYKVKIEHSYLLPYESFSPNTYPPFFHFSQPSYIKIFG